MSAPGRHSISSLLLLIAPPEKFRDIQRLYLRIQFDGLVVVNQNTYACLVIKANVSRFKVAMVVAQTFLFEKNQDQVCETHFFRRFNILHYKIWAFIW